MDHWLLVMSNHGKRIEWKSASDEMMRMSESHLSDGMFLLAIKTALSSDSLDIFFTLLSPTTFFGAIDMIPKEGKD